MKLEIKFWIWDSWVFFPKIIFGLPGNKITGIKVLKKKWGQVWDVYIKRSFLPYICILNIARGAFNINPLFFHCWKHPNCSHAFLTIKGLFPVTYLYEIIQEPEKSPGKQSLKTVGLYFQRLFISRTFFHRPFLVPKFRTLFPKTFFQKTFLVVTNFDTFLYQFLDTGTLDRARIGLDQLLKFLGFSLYPFHFSFTV